MTETIQQTKKIGGSLMVRIPKELVTLQGIREGEYVQISVQKMRKDHFGTIPKLIPFTKEDRLHSKHE
jgi:antitoxin component of MazEF toxin-antitoxin module